jgi:hypothetical protein
MLTTQSDNGYFGLRRSLARVFDKAVSSWCENACEEHGLTEDGKTVAPTIKAFCSLSISAAECTHPSSVHFTSASLTFQCKIFAPHKEIKR